MWFVLQTRPTGNSDSYSSFADSLCISTLVDDPVTRTCAFKSHPRMLPGATFEPDTLFSALCHANVSKIVPARLGCSIVALAIRSSLPSCLVQMQLQKYIDLRIRLLSQFSTARCFLLELLCLHQIL